MEISVLNIQGKDTGKKVNLQDTIFGIEPNDHAIYLDVKQYLANQRQGTSKSKEKSEVSGSTRKLKKQKGTGTARSGSIKSPVFRGGGRVFGPKPRNYFMKVNKKVKQLARKSALAYKAKENKLLILEDIVFDSPKTSKMVEIQNNLKLGDKNLLFVVANPNNSVYLSSRNLQGVSVVTASDLNTYQILRAKSLVVTESSVAEIENILK
jgi:large subunit ribosomal protein L4